MIASNERGMALVSVMLVGMILSSLLAGGYFLANKGRDVSGIDRRYMTELESAKGVAEFVMAEIRLQTISCGSNTCVPGTNANIDLPANLCNALGKTGCTNISATLLSQTSKSGETVNTFAVVSNAPAGESARVEVVYKVW